MKAARQLLILLLSVSLSGVFFGCAPTSSGDNQGSEDNQSEDSDANSAADSDVNAEEEGPLPVLLIGLDGFKPDYLGEPYGSAPTFELLVEGGVLAESLRPVFPSKTFVNLYSIATGLYPENHGIVGNVVYDAERDERLEMHDADAQAESHWWGGEPIWITAERQGLRSGTYFWVGSEAEINGHRSTHWVSYDSSISYRERIDQVVEWLSGEDPVSFASIYFAGADGTGHSYGPNSAQMVNTVRSLDNALKNIIDALDDAGIWPNINLIIASDHGMVTLDEDKVILLDEIIDTRDAHIVEWTPVAMLAPRSGLANKLFRELNEDNPYRDHYEVYRRDDLPEKYRLKGSDRVPEIVVVADMPYTITTRSFLDDRGVMRGGHGYDPDYPEMHGFFLAHGPDFRQGHRSETLHLVDLYELFAHLLELDPAENDGDLDRIGDQVLVDR